MQLQHLHLAQPTRYRLVSAVQEILVRGKINHHFPQANGPAPQPRDARPTLLTYSALPTYTSGRRQTLTASDIHLLEHGSSAVTDGAGAAEYVPSPRGGLLTFHGPGQLTAYPILHLRTHALTPRCYVRLLETSIIATLRHYGVRGCTRDAYPGVWISPTQKLASVGVHVRRGVTCFGAGINVATDPAWWRRVTACGIAGVEMVNLRDVGVREAAVSEVGTVLAQSLAAELKGVDGVDAAPADEATALLTMAEEQSSD